MPSSKRSTTLPLSIRGLCLSAFVAAALLLAPAAASALPAPTLLATTGGAGNSSVVPPPSQLYRVDPANGSTTALGNTGYAITALAQDPTTGILYAASNNKSPTASNTLLKLDPANGAATAVGTFGELSIPDMSFDSTGRLFGWAESSDELVSIDKNTGTATIVGPNEISTYGAGFTFDVNETLWLFGEGEPGPFWSVDPATGVPTQRGELTAIDEEDAAISAASADCARTTIYGALNNFGKPPANLLTIDTGTGQLTNKGSTVTGIDGLEWYCPLAFEFSSTAPITVPAGKAQTLGLAVVRGPRIKGAASVNYATVPGSAQAGRDFASASGTLSFGNNVSGGSFAVTVTPDPKAGKNRSFEIALSNPSSGGTTGGAIQVTINASKPKPAKVKGPKKTTSQRPAFKLKSNQLPARFRCKLDKGKFKGCGKAGKKAKKYKTPKLELGKHKLVVQVVNGAGKKSKPAKKTFTILAKG